MSEKIQEQISAFLDGELPANEAELLVHRFSRDDDLRQKALRYRSIGAAMRNELLYPDPNALRRGIQSALDGDSVVAKATDAPGFAARRLARPMVGLAVAATVAVVAITGLQNIATQGRDGQALPQAANQSEPDALSYVVPREPVESGVLRPVPILLTNYLVNHGEYASGLGRKSIHSDIVGFRSSAEMDEGAGSRESR
jgi:sigma-E factor negative regulatory protein RseA